jgi:hypothetical protein
MNPYLDYEKIYEYWGSTGQSPVEPHLGCLLARKKISNSIMSRTSDDDDEDSDDSSTCAPDGYHSPVIPETQRQPELNLVPSPVRQASYQRYPLRNTPDRQQHQQSRYLFVNSRYRNSSSSLGASSNNTDSGNLVTASTTAATTNNTSSINNNIDAAASSSANASTSASTTASTGNRTQRAASSKLPPNRSKGSKNYSRDEVEHLLKSVFGLIQQK